jgi:acetyl-CoA C-acetyltransferase
MIRDEVAIIGVGCTKFGENFDKSFGDMVVDAAYEAYEDAGIDPNDIQAAWMGTSRGELAGERTAGCTLAVPLKLYHKPISRVCNFCATGMDSLRNACFAVACGMYDIVLVVGAEKMRASSSRSLVEGLTLSGHPYLIKGRTAPGFFSLLANRYFHQYKIGRETLAKIVVKNHHNGTMSPKAHFQMEVTMDQVLNAPMVAEPLGRLDCCPTTDGAAAAIITNKKLAKKFRSDPIWVKGIGLAVWSEENVFIKSFDFLGFPANRAAAQQAYDQAGIKNPREEIDFASVHDCFSVTEMLIYEDLGFAKPGEGWRFIDEGICTLEGDLPVNTDGGLKSFGHPIGASGLRITYEMVKQLQGKAGPRQVKNAKIGLGHMLGGPGALACVTILGN